MCDERSAHLYCGWEWLYVWGWSAGQRGEVGGREEGGRGDLVGGRREGDGGGRGDLQVLEAGRPLCHSTRERGSGQEWAENPIWWLSICDPDPACASVSLSARHLLWSENVFPPISIILQKWLLSKKCYSHIHNLIWRGRPFHIQTLRSQMGCWKIFSNLESPLSKGFFLPWNLL